MNMKDFHVVLGFSYLEHDLSNSAEVLDMYKRLEARFTDVSFWHYQDERNPITYIPSVVPHLLKKHFALNPWLENEAVFLTDPDQLWIKKPDYSDLLADDKCYVSDSRGFINHSYLTWGNRPKHLIDELESLVGLTPGKILEENDNSGGSHYLLKGVNWQYFEKVEKDSNDIYKLMLDYNAKYDREWGPTKENGWIAGVSGVQAWSAFMHSLLYNLWYFAKEVRVTDRLAFCWGSDTIDKWHSREILHLAGVTSANSKSHNLFYKASYTTKLPYDDVMNNTYNEGYATNEYVKILREIAPNSCLVVSS
jgi:hypothetical protein